jgi:hypothetical protein
LKQQAITEARNNLTKQHWFHPLSFQQFQALLTGNFLVKGKEDDCFHSQQFAQRVHGFQFFHESMVKQHKTIHGPNLTEIGR